MASPIAKIRKWWLGKTHMLEDDKKDIEMMHDLVRSPLDKQLAHEAEELRKDKLSQSNPSPGATWLDKKDPAYAGDYLKLERNDSHGEVWINPATVAYLENWPDD